MWSRGSEAFQLVVVYAFALLLAQGMPNPLVTYADDLSIMRMFSLPFFYLPLALFIVLLVVRGKRPRLLAFGLLMAFLSVHSFLCAGQQISAALRGRPTAWRRPPPEGERLGRGWRMSVDVADLSWTMPDGVGLFRSHGQDGGSGCNQYEQLATERDGAVVDGVFFTWSANHPTSMHVDWILPLATRPFEKRAYWLRREQGPTESHLFSVADDGSLHFRSPWWSLLPWASSLVPLALACLVPPGQDGRRLVGGLVLLWCLAFSPWTSWGLESLWLPWCWTS